MQSVTSQGDYVVHTPETADRVVNLSKDELSAQYCGIAALISPRLRFDNRTPTLRRVRGEHWFWSAMLRQLPAYKDSILGSLLINIFAIALPIFAMVTYDRVVPNNAVETLWALAVGIILLLGADLMLKKLRAKLIDEASARIDVEISASLMEQLLGIRYSDRPISTGSFAYSMRAFEQVRDMIASSTMIALVDIPFVVLYFICIAWISPWLMLPGLAMFCCIVIFGYLIQERLHALSESTFKGGSLRNAQLIESLSSLETVKSQNAQSLFQARWEQASRYIAKVGVQTREVSMTATAGTQWMQQMTSVILIISGVYLIAEQQLTLGGLIGCYMLTNRALAPAAQVVALLLQYQSAKTSLESLEAFMSVAPERDPGKIYLENAINKGTIEFRNVSFKYPGREEKALTGLSFRVEPGERVAVLGRVGSGKSTLQRLISTIYSPSEGVILIDGIDVRQLDPAEIRRSTGFVSQEVNLFYGTLRENIALANTQSDDNAILKAAEVASLTDFIKSHPEGLAMQVGERGEMLSGGQRQAIGIARAVLNQAPILLMDEPTSAMDFSTEAAVAANLVKFGEGRTLILATHRSTLLNMCTRIIVLDAGKIVADGPRDAVMNALSSGKITKAAP